jgi:hypothetical protein
MPKKVICDSWADTVEQLVRYKEITTNVGDYHLLSQVSTRLNYWFTSEHYKEAETHQIHIVGKDEENTRRDEVYYIVKLVPNISTNQEGKMLLEAEY